MGRQAKCKYIDKHALYTSRWQIMWLGQNDLKPAIAEDYNRHSSMGIQLPIWQSLTRNGQKIIFPPFRPYHSCLLRFKTIIPTVEPENGDRPNIRDGKAETQTTRKEREAPSNETDTTKEKSQPLMQDTTTTGFCTVWNFELKITK